MPGFALEPPQRAKAIRYLLLGWRPKDITCEIYCHEVTIYRIRVNLWMYNAPTKPCLWSRSCPQKFTPFNEKLILQFLSHYLTSSLEEMTWFMWEERGVWVSISTISCMLKKKMVQQKSTLYSSQYVSGSTA